MTAFQWGQGSTSPKLPENTANFTETQSGKKYVPQTPEAFSYDDDGNLLSDGRWSYTWDGENRLIAMEAIASAPASAKLKLEFLYDWKGRRIRKTVAPWNPVTSSYDAPTKTTKFVWDGWHLMSEIVNGVTARSYVWGPDLSGTLDGAGGVGGLLMVIPAGENPQMVFSDANGNVTMLADVKTGEVTAEYEYGPFGEVLRSTGELADVNPFRFSSKYQDAESGLLYYGYRYYDAGLGRWINRDPIEDMLITTSGIDANSSLLQPLEYIFNNNNGVNSWDFLGLIDQCNSCGPEMGSEVLGALGYAELEFDRHFATLPLWTRHLKTRFGYIGNPNCNVLRWAGRWDMKFGEAFNYEVTPNRTGTACANGRCEMTVRIFGNCHDYNYVNYAMFGMMARKCGLSKLTMLNLIAANKAILRPIIDWKGSRPYDEWKGVLPFALAGYDNTELGDIKNDATDKKCGKCPYDYTGTPLARYNKWPIVK